MHAHSWSTQGGTSQKEMTNDDFEVNFLTYELFGLTILRFKPRSADRRDRCVGDLGAITFKFWVQLSFEFTKILWENRLGTLSSSHMKTSKGGYHENVGWRFGI